MRLESAKSGFWNNNNLASSTLKKISILEKEIELWENLDLANNDVGVLLEFAESGEVKLNELSFEIDKFVSKIKDLELKMILGDPKDIQDAIVTIHPGAGGTESQDWAQMLFRMYSRWVEKKGFKIDILDYQPGEEAGIKDLTMEIKGDYSYGLLKSEAGVHRLVRISPFDSANKRHTSFASVFVSPEIDETIEIDINPSDLRIDTYRASGAGGQHVNKTDSAIRITHEPTGVVVQCQSQRSQHQNRDKAMQQLRAKLYEIEMQKLDAERQSLEESKSDIGWGSQIRSYVLDSARIKDLRTGYETSNCTAVLDGDLDSFIEASLKANI